MSFENISVNQIENGPERIKETGQALFEIARTLSARDSERYNYLFAPNASMKLTRIAEYLQNDPNPDLDNTLIANLSFKCIRPETSSNTPDSATISPSKILAPIEERPTNSGKR